MSSRWEPDGRGDVVLVHECETECVSEFDVCPGCGKTRTECVVEAGRLPPDVEQRRQDRARRVRAERLADAAAIKRSRR